MTTIALAVPHGVAARFLLRTQILPRLLDAGVRVVVLVPNPDEPYLQAELCHPDIVLERLQATNDPPRSRPWLALMLLRGHVLAGGARNGTLHAKLRQTARRLSAGRASGRVAAVALKGAAKLLWRSRALRRGLVFAETRACMPDRHRDILLRHRPDLLVTTSPGWFPADAAILEEARRAAVPTLACVLGWDNPTSKGYRSMAPQRTIAWSAHMAAQLAALHDLAPARIDTAGVPHFDRYVVPGAVADRADLFARLGLDPARRLVVFATATPIGFADNAGVARILAEAIEDGRLGIDAQLVVRLHPFFFRPDRKEAYDELEQLAREQPHVHLDVPEIVSERMRSDVTEADDERLAALLTHADVLVNVYSTTTLEAFLADTPVVFAGGWVGPGVDGEPDPRTYSSYEHLREIVAEGAVQVAATPGQLVEHVARYLADPSLERAQRERFARRETGPADGRAAERTADLILQAARSPSGARRPARLRGGVLRPGILRRRAGAR